MVLGEVEQRALGTWALLEEAGFLYLATKCNRSVKPTCGRRVASGSAAMGGGVTVNSQGGAGRSEGTGDPF